jgi:hypothetical protein
VERVVTVGTSAGGYAALLLGSLIGAHDVLAFSPQTFIDRWHRLWHRDRRWKKEMRAVQSSPGLIRRYLDLRRPLASSGVGTRFQLHFCERHRLDRIHARRLAGLPGVDLVSHAEGGHRLVRFLRDQGRLPKLLLRALTE